MYDDLIRELFNESLDSIVIIDAACTIRHVNSAAATLSGYAQCELVGQSLNMLLPFEIAQRHDDYVRTYLIGEKPSVVLGRKRDMELRLRSGVVIPVHLKAVDLGTHEGQRYFGAFISDQRAAKAIEQKNRELMQQLETAAMTDVLTELPNRRAFDDECRRFCRQSVRSSRPNAIAIGDIDLFKRVNDTYGHAAGDVVLRAVADAIRSQLRAQDFYARLGGEEIGIFLYALNQAEAVAT
jgi:PAS domain S-box-containing protein